MFVKINSNVLKLLQGPKEYAKFSLDQPKDSRVIIVKC